MRNNSLLALVLLILWGCGSESKYEFWDIEKFNMDETALTDGEEIKLIYTSRSPDNNKELEYYLHIIATSVETGDTINVLTTANNGFKKGDEKETFNFFNSDNPASKLLQMDLEDLESFDPEKIEMKKIHKVARDPKFDYIADNNYPTIIGVIGKKSK